MMNSQIEKRISITICHDILGLDKIRTTHIRERNKK